jgi:hypothetical protein
MHGKKEQSLRHLNSSQDGEKNKFKSLPLDSDIRKWDMGMFKAQGLGAGKTCSMSLHSALQLRKIACGLKTLFYIRVQPGRDGP